MTAATHILTDAQLRQASQALRDDGDTYELPDGRILRISCLLEIYEGKDTDGRPIVRNVASLGGVEATDPGMIADLITEVLSMTDTTGGEGKPSLSPCPNCGDPVDPGEQYCDACANDLMRSPEPDDWDDLVHDALKDQ